MPSDLISVACQHSGSYGPWYHVSRYRRSGARLLFVDSIGGHYRRYELSHLPTLADARTDALARWRAELGLVDSPAPMVAAGTLETETETETER